MKIAVAGIGYVGLSLAVLLSQKHDVTAVDICQDKVRQVNSRISPIRDKEIEEYMRGRHLKLSATTDAETAYREAELVIIATPMIRNQYTPELVIPFQPLHLMCKPSSLFPQRPFLYML